MTCPVCKTETEGDFTLDYCEFCWDNQQEDENYGEIFEQLTKALEEIKQLRKDTYVLQRHIDQKKGTPS